jgi:sucrose-6-phosphate hydrolase SacC (GH32 family)
MQPHEIDDKALKERLLPHIHITAPRGWMNDPCGPGYDPATQTYHLFYQCEAPVWRV